MQRVAVTKNLVRGCGDGNRRNVSYGAFREGRSKIESKSHRVMFHRVFFFSGFAISPRHRVFKYG